MISKIIKIVLFAVVVQWLFKQIIFLRIGHHVIPQRPGPCQVINGITQGSEDMEMITDDIAVITSGLCFRRLDCVQGQGKLYLLDLNHPSEAKAATIQWLNKNKAFAFQPHGLTVWKSKNEVIVLVVNHETEQDTVERFQYIEDTKTFKHLETITMTDLYLNDIKATGPRSFYFSNFQKFRGPILGRIEMIFGFSLGWVGYYDATKVQALLSNMFLPNGINMSPNGEKLYIANMKDATVDVYNRSADNSLSLVQKIETYNAVDNIDVNPVTGHLTGALVPVTWMSLLYCDYPNDRVAPSQVIAIETKDGLQTGKIRQLFSDNGEIIGSSSIGIYHKGKLVIGSVHDKAVFCEVKYFD